MPKKADQAQQTEGQAEGTATVREAREAYHGFLQLSAYRESGGDNGPVRNFLRGQPAAKRIVTKLLAELRPVAEASEEKVADLQQEHKGDVPALRAAIKKHLEEKIALDGGLVLLSSMLDENAYADLPPHLEHVLGPFYRDDRE